MERPTREINEYLDLQVAGIQKAVASLDRGALFICQTIGIKTKTRWATAQKSAATPSK